MVEYKLSTRKILQYSKLASTQIQKTSLFTSLVVTVTILVDETIVDYSEAPCMVRLLLWETLLSSSTNGKRISFIISFFEHLQMKILHSNRISSIIFFFEHLQGIPVVPLHYALPLR